MSDQDNKYDSLRKRLKGLKKVNAKGDFEQKLFARIREAEQNKFSPANEKLYAKDRKLFGWLEGLFRPAFIPAMGVTVVLLAAIIVYFGYFAKSKNTAGEQNTFTSAPYQKEGEFVIYVRKDADYPKNEIASLESDDKSLRGGLTNESESTPKPTEPSSDYRSLQPSTEHAPEIRMDKISDEQKQEMEKSVDRGIMKGDEKKGDDMKGFKNGKEAPSNYLRENKDDTNAEEKDVEQKLDGSIENQTINPSVKLSEDSLSTGKTTSHNRVATKRSKKDTLKTKKEPVDSSDSKDTDKK
jgi:hypothetical protein